MSDSSSRVPVVKDCCICIPDLRIAVIIIAVLGIVTCPAATWAFERHTYLIRMSCIMTSCTHHPDVVDINFHYVLSFGLSSNSGLDRSFINSNTTSLSDLKTHDTKNGCKPGLVKTLKYFALIVLLNDLVFLVTCIIFLIKMFGQRSKTELKWFLYTTISTTLLAFFYGMFYTYVCVAIGTGFPILEFVFTLIDLAVWSYFIIVIRSYKKMQGN